MIRNIEKKLNEGKFSETQIELEKYGEALLDHISVEDEEVFQMAEAIFNQDELEKIGHRFIDSDRDLGDKLKTELQEPAGSLRSQMALIN